jgi:hypothetical protein
MIRNLFSSFLSASARASLTLPVQSLGNPMRLVRFSNIQKDKAAHFLKNIIRQQRAKERRRKEEDLAGKVVLTLEAEAEEREARERAFGELLSNRLWSEDGEDVDLAIVDLAIGGLQRVT